MAATPIKRIEKDFLLKTLFDYQIPVMYLQERTEYILWVERLPKNDMQFRVDRSIKGVNPGKRIALMFDYQGQIIIFSTRIISLRDIHLITDSPEFLYKNLGRSFSRIAAPEDMYIQFTFRGDRYSLAFPRIHEYEPGEEVEDPQKLMEDWNVKNLAGLIDQMSVWIRGCSSNFKMVIFKEIKPSLVEERILAETGKIIFLPTVAAGFPPDDPYPKKRLITGEIFQRYLQSSGVDPARLDTEASAFIQEKVDAGFYSDLWVPIQFHEYVIGYIRMWIQNEQKAPFAYDSIDMLIQFSKILAFSLKAKGYFDAGLIKNDPFDGKVIDVSASGILFAHPHSSLSSILLPESDLSVKLVTPQRTLAVVAKIVRRYNDTTIGYFGCRFLDVKPEELRFLFEFLYGKPFLGPENLFLYGQV